MASDSLEHRSNGTAGCRAFLADLENDLAGELVRFPLAKDVTVEALELLLPVLEGETPMTADDVDAAAEALATVRDSVQTDWAEAYADAVLGDLANADETLTLLESPPNTQEGEYA